MIVPLPRVVIPLDGFGAPLDAPIDEKIEDHLAAEEYVIETLDGAPRLPARVTISAGSPAGLAHATASLAHLARLAVDGRYPAVRLEDGPRFSHRGLMLDLARHMIEVAVIEEIIEVLAELKLNRLHLHLTDDQGWRLEIPGWPELTRAGAATQVGGGTPASGGGYLTMADYRRLQDYANARGVVVIPEIDLPGHVNAAQVAYPALASEGTDPQPYEGIEVGFSYLDVRSPTTQAFLTEVLTAVAAATDGPWIHLGGDECLAMNPADFAECVARASEIVRAAGKTPICWHEAGRVDGLAPGTIGQYWNKVAPEAAEADAHGIDHAGRAAGFLRGGGTLVLSPADAVYLDHGVTADSPTGQIWSGGPIPLRRSFEWEPSAVLDVGEEALLGVEATLFTENVVGREQVFAHLLPRLAAVAERAWVPDGAATSYLEFTSRLAPLVRSWRERGIPVGPGE